MGVQVSREVTGPRPSSRNAKRASGLGEGWKEARGMGFVEGNSGKEIAFEM